MNKIIFFLIAILITACTHPVTYRPAMPLTAPMSSADNTVSMDRKQILNVLHAEVKRRHHMDVVFTVQYLRILGNWAYIETTGGGDPGINAVLRKSAKGHWMLAKSSMPCAPACPSGMASCADGEMICSNTLHQQFPSAPIGIFPTPNARAMVINP